MAQMCNPLSVKGILMFTTLFIHSNLPHMLNMNIADIISLLENIYTYQHALYLYISTY